MRAAAIVGIALALVLAGCATAESSPSVTPARTYAVTADTCASSAVIYRGRVAGSFLTTVGAIRAMAQFVQGDPWVGCADDHAAALCYVDAQVSRPSPPPGSTTAPPIVVRDVLVVIDGRPGIDLMKGGPPTRSRWSLPDPRVASAPAPGSALGAPLCTERRGAPGDRGGAGRLLGSGATR